MRRKDLADQAISQWAGTKTKAKSKKKNKQKGVTVKSEGAASASDLGVALDLDRSSEEPFINGDLEEDDGDAFDLFGADEDRKPQLDDCGLKEKEPASSDPLWAAVGFDEDVSFDFDDEDTPIDTTYKPFFTGGPSLNSKKHTGDGPTPMEDRLSFESKKRSTEDDDIIFVDDEVPPGPLECPVCSRSFVGSTVALSAHVASHFDDDEPRS